MTSEEFRALQPGAIVRHTAGTCAYIVMANYGSRLTAARVIDLHNPEEWVWIKTCPPDNQETKA